MPEAQDGRIRFNDITASYLEQQAEIDAAIGRVVTRSDFIGGQAIREFEQSFAHYTRSEGCVGTSSGTSALHLAMWASGITQGDEVITTPMTFIATSEAISLCGAKPVFADIDPVTLNLNPAAVEAAITAKTKAILFVYLHGNPGGAAEVAEIAQRHGLLFFEDCAQAHGARLEDGRHVGTLGAAAAFSFFPAKNLGAFGDAGAIISNITELLQKARQLANHGRSEKYLHQVEGTNARMDTLQAAVLTVKLARLDEQVVMRNKLASAYVEALGDLPIRFQLASTSGNFRHAWHLFTVRTKHRDALQAALGSAGIETGIHYPVPLHLQPAYKELGIKEGAFESAEETARETLSLPMYPQLPEESVNRVAEAVRKFFR